jgi:hypothetical protein
MTETSLASGAVIGTIQTDTFCEGCGYNMHTQAVTRDERLGILVARCPECGRFSAVGQTTTAARAWLNRLATILLTGWVFSLLILFALCSLFLGMVAYGHMIEMTDFVQVSGGPVPGAPPGTSFTPYKFVYAIKHIPPDDWEQQASRRWSQIWLATITVALGLVTGVLFSTLLWHCKGLLRLAAFLPPILGCGIAALGWASDPQSAPIRNWGLMQIGLYFGIDLLTIATGVLLGRRFARGMLQVLVPPKARQHLAFLWIVDGKTLKPQ